MAEGRALSPRRRALRLLAAGSGGAVAAWALAALGFGLLVGPSALVAVLIGGLITIGFFMVGQLVQVALAAAEPVVVMMASLVSYLFRVVAVALVAAWIVKQVPWVDGRQLGVTILIVLAGWLAAEVFAFSRLRVPAFDPPQGQTD
jgi:ATP synthase protein I